MKISKGKIALALIAFSLGVLVSMHAFAGKKVCAPYKKQYQNLQKQLRQNSRGASRAKKLNKEQQLFVQWRRCEQGKLPKKKKSTQKSRSRTRSKSKNSTHFTAFKGAAKPLLGNYKPLQQVMSKSLKITSRFKGVQQQAWLSFYKRPVRCIRPKNTQEFAFCIEHEREQQQLFLRNVWHE